MDGLDKYHIRRLLPFDIDAFRRHLKRLDIETRQLRFGSPVNDAFLDNYADSAYRLDTIVYGAFEGGEIHASAELRPITLEDGGKAEIAFTVEREDQSHGLGTLLMECLVTAAQNRNIQHLYVICLAGNDKMRHLAEKFGAHMKMEYGELSGEIRPSVATPMSYLDETMREANGLMLAMLDWRLPA